MFHVKPGIANFANVSRESFSNAKLRKDDIKKILDID